MGTRKLKNKNFLKWSRAEPCVRKDNIISTDWHERLEKLPLFVPSYAKCQPNMYYIMSMEYARLWQKEKEEWFSNAFKSNPKQQDIFIRRKKLRKEFLEAKRQADIKIQERKERVAKEREVKLKIEAEALERAREKVKRLKEKLIKKTKEKAPKKMTKESDKKNMEVPQSTKSENAESGSCPKGWKQVELTLQCECQENKGHDKIVEKEETKIESNQQTVTVQEPNNKNLENKPCSLSCIENQVEDAVLREQQKEAKEQECPNK